MLLKQVESTASSLTGHCDLSVTVTFSAVSRELTQLLQLEFLAQLFCRRIFFSFFFFSFCFAENWEFERDYLCKSEHRPCSCLHVRPLSFPGWWISFRFSLSEYGRVHQALHCAAANSQGKHNTSACLTAIPVFCFPLAIRWLSLWDHIIVRHVWLCVSLG